MPPVVYFFTPTAKRSAPSGVCAIYFTIVTPPTKRRPVGHAAPNGHPRSTRQTVCRSEKQSHAVETVCHSAKQFGAARRTVCRSANNSTDRPTTVPIGQQQHQPARLTTAPNGGSLHQQSLTWQPGAPCARGASTTLPHSQPTLLRPTATATALLFSPHGTTCPHPVPLPARQMGTNRLPALASTPVAPHLISYLIPAWWLHLAHLLRMVPSVCRQRPPHVTKNSSAIPIRFG